MKRNVLMMALMGFGLSACQSYTAQMQPQQHSRIKISPMQQWSALQDVGYDGVKPEKVTDYLLLGKNAQQREQARQLLKAQLQHDPSGEKELLYIANLMQVIELEPGWADEIRKTLWARQQRRGDVMYELITFYARYPQQPGYADLRQLVSQSDKRLAPNQRAWLWAMVRLPEMMKTQTTAAELRSMCQQISFNTPAFGYVQPSDLQLCRRAQLMVLRQNGSNDWPELFTAVSSELKSGRLLDSDLLPLMQILQSTVAGAPMNEQALALGRLAQPQNHDVALAVISILLSQPGDEVETKRLEQQLRQLQQQGDPQASYLLGRLYLEGRRKATDPVLAEKMLKAAADLPEANYLLGRLYLSGLLTGTPQIQQGVDLLVQAARQGHARADEALAIAFHNAPGVKANPVYAWVFSSLAQQKLNSPSLQQLRSSLVLDKQHQLQANTLLMQELRARNVDGMPLSIVPQLASDGDGTNSEEQNRNDSELVNNF
ncbi:hypothetical protein [uncultured Tolumonas sp.]|uniref:tetratricopeptide repeat protein n=1 Tax=uncultured Tolumonas sp. TaxID=263765 RepID=UPI00292E13FC|nr:hypothetical protein [uncultured Tolumonas sp.]